MNEISENVDDEYDNYLKDYHQYVEIPKSRVLSNLSESWILRVINSRNSSSMKDNENSSDPRVRKEFLDKYPVMVTGDVPPLFSLSIKDLELNLDQPSFGLDKYPGYDPTDPERPAILKDGGSDLEKQSLSESDEYDAQISHPLPVEENAHRSVFSRLLNKKPARADIGNGSHDSLETEEIELDFSPTANAPSKSKRLQSLDRTRSSMEYSRTGEGDGRETSLDRVRTSLDLPGVETANSLMERLSK